MRKTLLAAIAATATATSLLVAGDSEIPHSFKRGTVINPDEMNENFSAVADDISAVANRVTELENAEPPVLSDQSVTSRKLADAAVTASKLAAGAVTTQTIVDSAVTAAKLAPGSVTGPELGEQSVTSGKLADAAVTTSKLSAGAVTTETIADSAITAAKLAPGAITDSDTTYTSGDGLTLSGTTFSLGDAGVTTTKLAGNAVTADKLASNAVTSAKLADGVVTSAKLVDSAVTSAKLANGAVTGSKLAAKSVSADKLAQPPRPLLVDYAAGTLSVDQLSTRTIDRSLTVPVAGKILVTVSASLNLADGNDDGFIFNDIDVRATVGSFGGGDDLTAGSSHRGLLKDFSYAWSATRSYLIDAVPGRTYPVQVTLTSGCSNCPLDVKYSTAAEAVFYPGA